MITRNSIIRILLFVYLLSTFNVVKAQPAYSWAKYFDNPGQLDPSEVDVDAAGNVYSTGYFSGTADFDPGSGTRLLTSKGGNDIYITKSDASGNLLWAKSVGGKLSDFSFGIKTDAAGNVYITGNFIDTVDFDPGTGEQIQIGSTEPLQYYMFILKLDTDGNYVWVKSLTGNKSGYSAAIAIDGTGNVYTTGNFNGITDFDPGPATYNLNAGGTGFNPDIFILKLDASGNYVWAKNIGNSSNNMGSGIAVDAVGNVYTTGYFTGTVDFDPGTGIQNLSSVDNDIFILKLDAAGDYVWAKQIGASGTQRGEGIAVDASQNVYSTGTFTNTVDFDPGSGVYELVTNADDNVYVSKLDAAGNYVWAVSVGGAGTEFCESLALDNLNNVYLTGSFTDVVDFDPGSGTHNLTPTSGSSDVFILKLDASGAYQWAANKGSSGEDNGVAIAVTASDNVYTIGSFEGTVDFDSGSGTQELTTVATGAYILHLVPSPLPLALLNFSAIDKETEVQLQWKTSQEENTASFTIERSSDGKKFENIGSVAAANNNLINNYTYKDAQPVTGTAFYRLKMIDKDGRFTNSRSVSVTRNGRTQHLQVSPNPAKELLNVQANGIETVQLQITDATGRIWQQQHISLNGKTSTSINIQALPAGVYYLVMKGKQIQHVQQFIKQ
ncbi:MAG TPA: SBBP repeat-containing protein [Niastella sp.]